MKSWLEDKMLVQPMQFNTLFPKVELIRFQASFDARDLLLHEFTDDKLL